MVEKAANIPAQETVLKIEIMHRTLETKEGHVILPPLHNIYYSHKGPEGEEGVEGACLEFGFFGWGLTLESASSCLENLASVYFRERINKKEFQQILDDISSDYMEPYWALYRKLSVLNAASGNLPPYLASLQKNVEDSKAPLEDQLAKQKEKIEELQNLNYYLLRENERLKNLNPEKSVPLATIMNKPSSEIKVSTDNFVGILHG